jgi:deazaflavin-dependent oxidoreductase (nitroreductase family)
VANSRFQRLLEKYVTNPPVRLALRLGIAPRAFALVETTGRGSGQRRRTPVGNGLDGAVFWLIAQRGVRCGYVQNLLADPRVRVKVGRQWRSGMASIIDGDDSFARRRALDSANGPIGRLDGVLFRAAASEPITIRVDLDSASSSAD